MTESEEAIFRCSLSNASFSVYWLVNDSDADLAVFHQSGVFIMSVNATSSHLHILGRSRNNHTCVQCVGVLYHNFNLVAFQRSDKALLTILGG